MYRTFTSIMLGLGLGFLLLSPVNAEQAFSTLKGISAEPLSEVEMESVEGKSLHVNDLTFNTRPVIVGGLAPLGVWRLGPDCTSHKVEPCKDPAPMTIDPTQRLTIAPGLDNGNLPALGVHVSYMK